MTRTWAPGRAVHLVVLASLVVAIASPAPGQSQSRAAQTLPDNASVRRVLAQRADREHKAVGIVAGLIDSTGRRIVAYGSTRKEGGTDVDGDTVFEIGSITKVFTALLLADMVERGEVALDDPVSRYLPAAVRVPQRGDRAIRLRDLATHTSGLPENPTNHRPKDWENPFADYTAEKLYQLLATYRLQRDPGAQYEYSNLGAGLLAHALANRAATDYEVLLRQRILDPLALQDTRITLTPVMQSRLAQGHDEKLRPVRNWDGGVLAGAAALRSTANDMLSFLAAALGFTASPLNAAMTSMRSVRVPTAANGLDNGLDVALGWHVLREPGREIISHEGATGGYESFVGFDPDARVGVVVLANTITAQGLRELATNIIAGQSDPAITP